MKKKRKTINLKELTDVIDERIKGFEDSLDSAARNRDIEDVNYYRGQRDAYRWIQDFIEYLKRQN